MTRIVFTVVEEAAGWFVNGGDPLGPFFSHERALDLAQGMVAAIRASGGDAELGVQGRSWTPPGAVAAARRRILTPRP
jgi:hypothetical protein